MPSTKKTPAPRSSKSSVQTPLETYLREINETALLTAADERELAVTNDGGVCPGIGIVARPNAGVLEKQIRHHNTNST